MAHPLDWKRQKERRQFGERTREIIAANAYVRDLAAAKRRRQTPRLSKAEARELCNQAVASHPIKRYVPARTNSPR